MSEPKEEKEIEHQHHIVSPLTYAAILGALLVFTALTVLVSYFDLGEWHIAQGVTLFWNPVLALLIAHRPSQTGGIDNSMRQRRHRSSHRRRG